MKLSTDKRPNSNGWIRSRNQRKYFRVSGWKTLWIRKIKIRLFNVLFRIKFQHSVCFHIDWFDIANEYNMQAEIKVSSLKVAQVWVCACASACAVCVFVWVCEDNVFFEYFCFLSEFMEHEVYRIQFFSFTLHCS